MGLWTEADSFAQTRQDMFPVPTWPLATRGLHLHKFVRFSVVNDPRQSLSRFSFRALCHTATNQTPRLGACCDHYILLSKAQPTFKLFSISHLQLPMVSQASSPISKSSTARYPCVRLDLTYLQQKTCWLLDIKS